MGGGAHIIILKGIANYRTCILMESIKNLVFSGKKKNPHMLIIFLKDKEIIFAAMNFLLCTPNFTHFFSIYYEIELRKASVLRKSRIFIFISLGL